MTVGKNSLKLESLQDKIQDYWKEYAELFNNFDPENADFVEERMDSLLEEIRSLEEKRNKLADS